VVDFYYYRVSIQQLTLTDASTGRNSVMGHLGLRDLVPIDQFHTRGLAAVRKLLELVQIVHGSGWDGVARVLASEQGCKVTGIDILAPALLGLHLAMAEPFRLMQANLLRNLEKGRIAFVRGVILQPTDITQV